MTLRYSNSGFIQVTEGAALENIGWTLIILAESDYATVLAPAERFLELNYTKEYNDVGGGGVTLELDDRIFIDPLPAGQTVPIREQQALYQVYHNGILRGEFFAEDVDEKDIDPDWGTRTFKISGRGTASVLERAVVFPLGMPAPSTLTRTFTGHIMSFWLQLLTEAQARGTITYVNPQFTSTQDSAGQAWNDNQVYTVSAGDNLLTLLSKWCEALGKRWLMAPGFKLYIYPEEGNHRETAVTMTVYADQQEANRQTTRKDIANVVAAQAGDKAVAVATDSISMARWGRRESWLSAGDAGDVGTAQIIANATAKIRSDQTTQRSFKIPFDAPNKLVFKDYDVGDWIGVEIQDYPTNTGAMESKHVAALSIKVDNDNGVDCEITLESKFEVRARRLQRILDKLGGSSVGGGSTQQGSVPLAITSYDLGKTKLSDLADASVSSLALNQSLVWNGSRWVNRKLNVSDLGDVDLTGNGVGKTLVFDGTVWEAVTPVSAPVMEAIAIDVLSVTVAASGTAFACKGNFFRGGLNSNIVELIAYGNWTTGNSYKFVLLDVTDPAGTPAISLLNSVTVSGPSSTGLRYMSSGAIAWSLDIGKLYYVAVIDMTSDTAACPVAAVSSQAPQPGQGINYLKSFATVASRTPGAATALTITKTGVGYCINVRTQAR